MRRIQLRLASRDETGERVTAESLARELGVSSRTIKRDLENMRDDFNLPISYDEGEHSWVLTAPVADFPMVPVTEGELVSLVLARAALHGYKGMPFAEPLRRALQKLEDALPSAMDVDMTELARAVSFRQRGSPVPDMKQFETLADAVIRRQVVTFDYSKQGAKDPERRTVHPYHLTSVAREWYLVAHDESRKAIRNFRLGAMGAVVADKKRRFTLPADFHPESHFSGAFGLFVGDDVQCVRIRFTGRSAEVVPKGEWHPSQKFHPQTDGSVVLEMRTGGLLEIAQWVLSFGKQAEVLEPPELRERVVVVCRGILQRYGVS